MREILFKAKRIDNGKWAEGCLVIDHSRSSLFEYRMRPVGIVRIVTDDVTFYYEKIKNKNRNRED